jgi:iron complex transport system substrate-binding protein
MRLPRLSPVPSDRFEYRAAPRPDSGGDRRGGAGAAGGRRPAAGEDLYTLDEGALRNLDPDVIVTQDLCAVCAVAVTEVEAALDHLGCRAHVLTLDPMTLSDVLGSVVEVGRVTGHLEPALQIKQDLIRRLDAVASATSGRHQPRVAVLEWTDPPFSSGHWVPDMVSAAGGVPVLGRVGARSQQIGWDDVTNAGADMIVVAPCGFRLDGAIDLAKELVAAGRLPDGIPVWAVDADAAFVRPGPRLVDGIEALAAVIHPGCVELDESLAALV